MTGPVYPPSSGPGPGGGGRRPAKKGSKGCLIALLVVFIGFAMVLVAAGVGLYEFSETEDGKRAFEIASETWRVQADARDAPGVAELKAIGCQEAMVMDLSRLAELLEEDDAEAELEAMPTSFTMVSCVTKSEDLGCEAAKAAFLSAVPSPAGPFMVQVTHRKVLVETEGCEQTYAADGSPIQLEDDEAPADAPIVAPRGPSTPGR